MCEHCNKTEGYWRHGMVGLFWHCNICGRDTEQEQEIDYDR